jgi:hypothetical protein
MYIFIKGELTTVPHLPEEKRVIAFAFVVDNTTSTHGKSKLLGHLLYHLKALERE